MGTFSEADGEELRRMIEDEAEFYGLERLFGLRGWSRGAAPRPSPRPRDAQGREAAVIRHDWTRGPGGAAVRKGTYIHPADAAAARQAGAVWHGRVVVPREIQIEQQLKSHWNRVAPGRTARRTKQHGLMYFPEGRTVPEGLRTIVPRGPERQSGRLRDVSPGAAFQAYIERDGAVEIDAEGNPISLGWMPNLTVHTGEDGERLDRMAFWRAAEGLERRGDARIQGRIIAELPYEPEVGPEGRRMIVEYFGTLFDALGLPWWAVVHTPEPGHDDRNYHVHLLYSERPWRYEQTAGPYGDWKPSARKSEATRHGGWIDRVRAQYVDAMNLGYERAGLDRRIAKESYRARGVDAVAQAHLGNAASALERRGIATGPGSANGGEQARRELAPRLKAHGAQRVGAYERRTARVRSTISEARSVLTSGTSLDGYLVRGPGGREQDPVEAIRAASRLLRLTDVAMARMIQAELHEMADEALRARWPDRVDAVARSVALARRTDSLSASFFELDERQLEDLETLTRRLSTRMREAAERRRTPLEKLPPALEIRESVMLGTDTADRFNKTAEAALRIGRMRQAEARVEETGARYRETWQRWHGDMAPGVARIARTLIARDFRQALEQLLRDRDLDAFARKECAGAVGLLAKIAVHGRGTTGLYPKYVMAAMARARASDAETSSHPRRKAAWVVVEKLANAFVQSEARFETYVASLQKRLREGCRGSVPATIREATHAALMARVGLTEADTALAAAIKDGRVRKQQETPIAEMAPPVPRLGQSTRRKVQSPEL